MPVNSFENYPMSWKPKLVRCGQPLYLELAEELKQDIEKGTLLPGTKLPPQRELADFLDINVSTVSKAFKLCSEKGLLNSVTGRGTFVAYDVLTDLSLAPAEQPQMIEMGSMMPETLQEEEISSLLRQMLAEPQRPSLFQYTHGREKWHRQAASLLLQKAGVTAKSQDILLASGGQNALVAVLATYFQAGDRIGVDPLVYPGFKSAAKLLGIRLVPIGQAAGEMSADGLLYAMKNYHIKGLYLTPDFQNPTAHILSIKGRQRIAGLARKYQLLIIEDAITSLLLKAPPVPIKQLAPEQTVYILSMSKTILPALRMAYILPPEGKIEKLQETLNTLNLSQSEILLELASRLIVSGKADTLMALRRPRIVRRNQIVNQMLAGYNVQGNEYSISRWLVLPWGMTGSRFEALAAAKGVHVLGAEHFAVGTQPPQAGVRLAIGSPQSEAELAEGLRRLKEILSDA